MLIADAFFVDDVVVLVLVEGRVAQFEAFGLVAGRGFAWRESAFVKRVVNARFCTSVTHGALVSEQSRRRNDRGADN